MKALIILTLVVLIVAALPTGCGRQEAQPPEGKSSPSANVLKLDESNFDAQIQTGVVLVDFWATWCGPCKVQGPIVQQVADQIGGKAKVAKLDVDAAPKVAQQFNVHGIPTLIVFKDGKPVKQFVGVTKADKLVAAITAALDAK